MLTRTGMSTLPDMTPENAETLCDDHLRTQVNLYTEDRYSVAVVTAMLLHRGQDDNARTHATEYDRLDRSLNILTEERGIRRTTEASIAAIHAELAKGGA